MDPQAITSPPSDAAPPPPKSLYMTKSESWYKQLVSTLPGIEWGFVRNDKENKTYFLLILMSTRTVSEEEFGTLDLEQAVWVFKEAKMDAKSWFLAAVGLPNETKRYDFIIRAPGWAETRGTQLFRDEKVTDPTLSKSGMTLGISLPSTVRSFVSFLKKKIVVKMIDGARTALWFQLPKNPKASDIEADQRDILAACVLDDNAPNIYMGCSADTHNEQVEYWRGDFSLDDDGGVFVSEYMTCPLGSMYKVFGGKENLIITAEGLNRALMKEHQLSDVTGIFDVTARYQVPRAYENDKEGKHFSLKFICRRMQLLEAKPHLHPPLDPIPLDIIQGAVMGMFAAAMAPQIENKRLFDGDISEGAGPAKIAKTEVAQIEDKSGATETVD